MLDIDHQLPHLKRGIQRLLGPRIELDWVRGCDLDPVATGPEWTEQLLLEMAVRCRAAMPYGGRLVMECCNLEVDDTPATTPRLSAGRYVMVEMSCLRKNPFDDGGTETISLPRADEFWQDSGLSPTIDRVKSLGGTFCEYNEPSRGLTLRIFLPSATHLLGCEGDVAHADGNNADTILLVEDEAYLCDVASEILETAGYKVITARTGKEALAVFEKHAPVALLVTDVVMPGINGRELSSKLTSLQPGLKTIYLSGATENAVIRLDFDTERSVYVQKPFTLESFTSKVKEVLATATA